MRAISPAKESTIHESYQVLQKRAQYMRAISPAEESTIHELLTCSRNTSADSRSRGECSERQCCPDAKAKVTTVARKIHPGPLGGPALQLSYATKLHCAQPFDIS